jgi:hypothetical protein
MLASPIEKEKTERTPRRKRYKKPKRKVQGQEMKNSKKKRGSKQREQ